MLRKISFKQKRGSYNINSNQKGKYFTSVSILPTDSFQLNLFNKFSSHEAKKNNFEYRCAIYYII